MRDVKGEATGRTSHRLRVALAPPSRLRRVAWLAARGAPRPLLLASELGGFCNPAKFNSAKGIVSRWGHHGNERERSSDPTARLRGLCQVGIRGSARQVAYSSALGRLLGLGGERCDDDAASQSADELPAIHH